MSTGQAADWDTHTPLSNPVKIITYRMPSGNEEKITVPPATKTLRKPPKNGKYLRAVVTGIPPAQTQKVQLVDGLNRNILDEDVTEEYHDNGIDALKSAFAISMQTNIPVLRDQVDIRN